MPLPRSPVAQVCSFSTPPGDWPQYPWNGGVLQRSPHVPSEKWAAWSANYWLFVSRRGRRAVRAGKIARNRRTITITAVPTLPALNTSHKTVLVRDQPLLPPTQSVLSLVLISR